MIHHVKPNDGNLVLDKLLKYLTIINLIGARLP